MDLPIKICFVVEQQYCICHPFITNIELAIIENQKIEFPFFSFQFPKELSM